MNCQLYILTQTWPAQMLVVLAHRRRVLAGSRLSATGTLAANRQAAACGLQVPRGAIGAWQRRSQRAPAAQSGMSSLLHLQLRCRPYGAPGEAPTYSLLVHVCPKADALV